MMVKEEGKKEPGQSRWGSRGLSSRAWLLPLPLHPAQLLISQFTPAPLRCWGPGLSFFLPYRCQVSPHKERTGLRERWLLAGDTWWAGLRPRSPLSSAWPRCLLGPHHPVQVIVLMLPLRVKTVQES